MTLHYTTLIDACERGMVDNVKQILLSDTEVDVNLPNNIGNTPLYISCYKGNVDIVKLLLSDSRIQVNKGGAYLSNYCTPLLVACEKCTLCTYNHCQYCNTHSLAIVRLLLGHPRIFIPIGLQNNTLIADILTETNSSYRTMIHEHYIPDIFLLMVLVSDMYYNVNSINFIIQPSININNNNNNNYIDDDNYLIQDEKTINNNNNIKNKIRFFCICDKLPMEIQMLVSNIVYGSTKQFITTHNINNRVKYWF